MADQELSSASFISDVRIQIGENGDLSTLFFAAELSNKQLKFSKTADFWPTTGSALASLQALPPDDPSSDAEETPPLPTTPSEPPMPQLPLYAGKVSPVDKAALEFIRHNPCLLFIKPTQATAHKDLLAYREASTFAEAHPSLCVFWGNGVPGQVNPLVDAHPAVREFLYLILGRCGGPNVASKPVIAYLDFPKDDVYYFDYIDHKRLGSKTLQKFLDSIASHTLRPFPALANFERVALLGAGSYGAVFKARNGKTGEVVAIKTLFGLEMKEYSLLRAAGRDCPNLVQPIAAYSEENAIQIAYEYCGGGSLYDMLQDKQCVMTDQIVATALRELLKAVAHLRKYKIVHRDIKPDNILLDASGNVKLADLGCGRFLAEEQLTMSQTGHVFVRSPEYSRGYNHKADIFAVGITALLLARKLEIETEPSMKYLSSLIRTGWDPWFRDFVALCHRPAELRPEAEELLHHKYIETFAKDPQEVFKAWIDSRSKQMLAKAHLFANELLPHGNELNLSHSTTMRAINIVTFAQKLLETLEVTPDQQTAKEMVASMLEDTHQAALSHALTAAVVGCRGSGKSSLINAILGRHVSEVGAVVAATKHSAWHKFSAQGQDIWLMDTRGNDELADPEPINVSMIGSFVGISPITPLEQAKAAFSEKQPDFVLFTHKAKDMGRIDLENNLKFLRSLLEHFVSVYKTAPLQVIAVATQCDELDPARERIPAQYSEAKKQNIDKAKQVLKGHVFRLLKDLPCSITLDTAAVSCAIDWNEDKTAIVHDDRYKVEEIIETLARNASLKKASSLARLSGPGELRLQMAMGTIKFFQLLADKLVLISSLSELAFMKLFKGILSQMVLFITSWYSSPSAEAGLLDYFWQSFVLEHYPKPYNGIRGQLFLYRGSYSWRWASFSCSHYMKCIGEAAIEYWTKMEGEAAMSLQQSQQVVSQLLERTKEAIFKTSAQ